MGNQQRLKMLNNLELALYRNGIEKQYVDKEIFEISKIDKETNKIIINYYDHFINDPNMKKYISFFQSLKNEHIIRYNALFNNEIEPLVNLIKSKISTNVKEYLALEN